MRVPYYIGDLKRDPKLENCPFPRLVKEEGLRSRVEEPWEGTLKT